ncbi:MAG: thioredoxin domain-containing protein [Bacteroidetes bacterium]|nr:thioredoxin domain-containing protein [Bacteroidota bacterium]
MDGFANRLIHETSPYLQQHAHNPVDWYPWGEEALQKAKKENKPIVISIGYAACHWCHVMEKESFEDIGTANFMNAHFINIKVDREERPDLDHIYMDAVQAITGSGGWPLNVFLTPGAKPFYGGTYFPPEAMPGRPSWKEVLKSVAEAFEKRADEIEIQAHNLTAYLLQADSSVLKRKPQDTDGFDKVFNKKNLDSIFENIMGSADKKSGGFGNAPKFPQTSLIQFLLYHFYFTGNKTALEHACLSLDKMIGGGIYDHIGGGFARYSTDKEWTVPHFEKMLYDNALLVTVLSESYQLTKNIRYKKTIEQTIDFISRELASPNGGFFSSLDADSEGVEGKYYLWNKKDIDNLLKEDSQLFCNFYNVSNYGNWEEGNILHTTKSEKEFAVENEVDEEYFIHLLETSKTKLLQFRARREVPRVDKKILLNWNALMIAALCKSYAALGKEEYKRQAVENMNFLLANFMGDDEYLFFHCYSNGKSKFAAFLDDYSFLVFALIQLQEITADVSYLFKARDISEYAIANFSSSESDCFFYTHKNQPDIIIRKKEIYDGATPSGNSIMAFNLLYLSKIFNKPEWEKMAISMCLCLEKLIIKYPAPFATWATLLQALTYNLPEIAIVGKEAEKVLKSFFSTFIPFKVLQSSALENQQFPLLIGKPAQEKTRIYVCKNYSCRKPVTEISELRKLLAELAEN